MYATLWLKSDNMSPIMVSRPCESQNVMRVLTISQKATYATDLTQNSTARTLILWRTNFSPGSSCETYVPIEWWISDYDELLANNLYEWRWSKSSNVYEHVLTRITSFVMRAYEPNASGLAISLFSISVLPSAHWAWSLWMSWRHEIMTCITLQESVRYMIVMALVETPTMSFE